MKKFICPYCGKEISSKSKLEIHINRCLENPNLPERYRMYKNHLMSSTEEYDYLHEIIQMTMNCEVCGKEYTISVTRKDFDIKLYRKTCSSFCSHKRMHSDDTKNKISESVKKVSEDCPKFLTDEIIESTEHYYKYYNNNKYLYIFNKRLKVYVCANCGKEYTIMHHRDNNSAVYCCKKCSNECGNENDKKFSSLSASNRICLICGDLNCTNEFCHNGNMTQKIKTLVKYFHFDENVIGTHKVFDEWNRIRDELYDMYINKHMSTIEISKIFNYNPNNLNNILRYFDINTRSLSEAIKDSYLYNRNITSNSYNFNCGYHTTWNNKTVYLRSSYELDYAKELDLQKIDYEVETIRLRFFDSQKNVERVTIPDFYIPSSNTIVEIKSNYTLDVQEMKDKVKAYKDNGYNFILILEHKEVDLYTLEQYCKNIKNR